MMGCCECGNELSGFIKYGEFVFWLVKRNCASWRSLFALNGDVVARGVGVSLWSLGYDAVQA